MNDELPQFESRVNYVGPFDVTEVVVDGRKVPFLNVHHGAGVVHLTLDRRFGLDLEVAEADRVIEFIAQAIAIALGYTCHPTAHEEPRRANLFPRVTGIELAGSDREESR